MPTYTEGVDIEYRARLEDFQKELGKIPGLTKKEARKLTREWVQGMKDTDRENARAVRQLEREWERGTGEIVDSIASIVPGLDGVLAQGRKVNEMLRTGAAQAKKMALALGAAGAVVATLGAVAAVNADMAEARERIVNVAEDTALLTSQVQALELAYERHNEDAEGGLDAMRDLGEVMFDFANGGGRAEEALSGLNIEVQRADGRMRAVSDVLPEIIAGMQALENDTLKVAYAQQLWGDDGARLLRILGDQTWDEHMAFAETYGLDVGPKAVQATREWERATTDLKIVMRDLARDTLGFFTGDNASGLIRKFTLGLVMETERVKSLLGGASYEEAWQAGILKAAEFWKAARPPEDLKESFQPVFDVMADVQREIDEASKAAVDLLAPPTDVPAAGGRKPSTPPKKPARSGTSKGLMLFGLSEVVEQVVALSSLQGQYLALREEVTAVELEGLEAIHAKYDEQHDRLMALRDAALEEQDFKDTLAEVEKRRIDDVTRYEMEKREEAARAARDRATSVMNAVGYVASSIAGIVTDVYDLQIDRAKEGSKEQKELLKQQFIAQKAAALVSAGINTALAVVQALGSMPPPASIAMAAVVGALGAVQIGLIAAQPAPFHTGGVIGPSAASAVQAFAPDEVPIRAKAGEGVLSQQGMRNVGGAQGLNDLNAGRAAGQPLVAALMVEGRVVEAAMVPALESASPSMRRALKKAVRRAGRRGGM